MIATETTPVSGARRSQRFCCMARHSTPHGALLLHFAYAGHEFGVADVVTSRGRGQAALGYRALAVGVEVREVPDHHRVDVVEEAHAGVTDGAVGGGHPRQRLPLLDPIAVGAGPAPAY